MTAESKRVMEEMVYDALQAGHTRRTAAAMAHSTMRAVADRLKSDSAFAAAVQVAEAQAEARATEVLFSAIEAGDWQAAAWWLERRNPWLWSPSRRAARRGQSASSSTSEATTMEEQDHGSI